MIEARDPGELRARDAAGRRAACGEFARPLVLEAGAGTGKTSSLVGRIVCWSLGPGWEKHADAGPERARRVLSRVRAITFTEAAAAEMAARVANDLLLLARGDEPPWWTSAELRVEPDEVCRRAELLVTATDALSAGTIHGYCAEILREHGLRVGMSPTFEVDAEHELSFAIAREVIEERLAVAYGEETDESYLELARRGHGPAAIEAALQELVRAGVAPQELASDAFSDERQAAYVDGVLASVAHLREVLPASPKGLGRSKHALATYACFETLDATAGRLRRGGLDELAALVRTSDGRSLLKTLNKWAKHDFNEGEKKAFGDAMPDIARRAAPAHERFVHTGKVDRVGFEAAVEVLRPLLESCRERMQRAGVATFDDLLRGAADLLERDPVVRSRCQRAADLLLVDEFQDTDERQCRLVGALALAGEEDDRPRLFLVGDPKQSIYAWRSADLRAYEGFVERVKAEGGVVHELTVNFRSRQEVLDEVERVLGPTMVHVPGLQPPFRPLLAGERAKETVPLPGPAVRYVHLNRGEDGGDLPAKSFRNLEGSRRDAAHFARSVAEQQARGELEFGDVALLLRSFTDLPEYLNALRAAGVPYEVGRDRGYYRRREVVEAAATVRAILDPTDQVALVACLRSSWVGVPDAAWVPLWRAGLPGTWAGWRAPDPATLRRIDALVAEASRATPKVRGIGRLPDWPAALRYALVQVVTLRAIFAESSGDRFVAELRRRTLHELSEASRFLGAHRLANLGRFHRELVADLERSQGDPTRVCLRLRSAVRERRDAEEEQLEDTARDAVRVMTVHGAKGLEFRWVHVGQLHKQNPRGGDNGATRVLRAGERTAVRLFGWPDLASPELEREAREVEAHERVRLVYVALTRAASRLTLAVSSTSAFAKSPGRAQRLQELVLRRQPSLAQEDDPHVVVETARPPAEDRSEDPSRANVDVDARLASLARDAAALTERRSAARDRQARPLVAPASTDLERALVRDRAGERLESELPAAEASAPEPLDRRVAQSVGARLHAFLETFRALDLEPERLAARGRALAEDLERELDPELLADGMQLLAEAWSRLGNGPLLERLARLEPRVVRRELPVILAADPSAGDEPVAAYVGTLDLLYRDEEELVVADYKSDRVETEDEIERAVAHHAPQLARYAEAVELALELDRPVRRELWFLHAGRVERAPA